MEATEDVKSIYEYARKSNVQLEDCSLKEMSHNMCKEVMKDERRRNRTEGAV